MNGFTMNVVGNNLVITVPMDGTKTPSKSGKSDIVATSGGNVSVPGTNLKIGLNVYQPK